jgi:hypothetical protein
MEQLKKNVAALAVFLLLFACAMGIAIGMASVVFEGI